MIPCPEIDEVACSRQGCNPPETARSELWVLLGPALSLEAQVVHQLQLALDQNNLAIIIHALMPSILDDCNTLYMGLYLFTNQNRVVHPTNCMQTLATVKKNHLKAFKNYFFRIMRC